MDTEGRNTIIASFLDNNDTALTVNSNGTVLPSNAAGDYVAMPQETFAKVNVIEQVHFRRDAGGWIHERVTGDQGTPRGSAGATCLR